MSDRRIRSHSQNFLRSPQFVADLLSKTDINRDDMVLEIGAGKGLITRELAKRSGKVVAIEVDPTLAAGLRQELGDLENVSILEADFLGWRLPNYPYKVFSNIPFNMTADIVGKLLDVGPAPSVTYLIMQDKAAERFIGDPVAKNSQTSVLLQVVYEMGVLAQVSRRQFEPMPAVDAVLAFFRRRDSSLVEPQRRQLFRDFVIYAYNQWRPTVLDSLQKVFSSHQRGIIDRELGIGTLKPSELSVDQWLKLFAAFTTYVPDSRKALVVGAESRLKEQQRKLTRLHRTR